MKKTWYKISFETDDLVDMTKHIHKSKGLINNYGVWKLEQDKEQCGCICHDSNFTQYYSMHYPDQCPCQPKTEVCSGCGHIGGYKHACCDDCPKTEEPKYKKMVAILDEWKKQDSEPKDTCKCHCHHKEWCTKYNTNACLVPRSCPHCSPR